MQDDNVIIRYDGGEFNTRDLSTSRQRPAVERVAVDHLIRFEDGRDLILTGMAAVQAYAQLTEHEEEISGPERYEENL